MKEEAENPPEEKPSRGFLRFLPWVGVIFLAYCLSSGPLVMLVDRNVIGGSGTMMRLVETVYSPLEWAYDETPLHKPIGIYLSLWSKRFNSNGDEK
jgi:hypothetical protein